MSGSIASMTVNNLEKSAAMSKEYELYAAGGVVVHFIFCKGVVSDYAKPSDPGKGHHPFGIFLGGKGTEAFWQGRKLGYVPINHNMAPSHLLEG